VVTRCMKVLAAACLGPDGLLSGARGVEHLQFVAESRPPAGGLLHGVILEMYSRGVVHES
jgi:hypothetical protein